jgi:hypothetical protein
MGRSVSLTFYGEFRDERQWPSLLKIVRQGDAVLIRGGSISAFTKAEDGMEYVSVPCHDRDPYETLQECFEAGRIASFDFGVVSDGVELRFNGNASFKDRLVLTVLGNYRFLEDGMIDFNWYYTFWISRISGELDVTGIEFSAFK